jgi:glutathione S-transferase
MKLSYHPVSSFIRKVYMLVLELGLAGQISLEQAAVAPVAYPGWSDDTDEVPLKNALAKIPTLMLNEGQDAVGEEREELLQVFDSKVICKFLQTKANLVRWPASDLRAVSDGKNESRRLWLEKPVHATADNILDAEILVIYEERIQAENGVKFETWADGQRHNVMQRLDFLEKQARGGTLRTRGLKARMYQ